VVIVGRRQALLSYPKPVTVDRQIARELSAGVLARQEERALRFQRLLYSRPVRRLALWFSAHDLPVATLNTYLQRFIPQPKQLIGQLNAGIRYAETSFPAYVVVLERGEGMVEKMTVEEILSILLEPRQGAFAFQPGPLLAEEMSLWNGCDWRQVEKEIVRAALAGCQLLRWRSAAENWWEQLPEVIGGQLPEGERSAVKAASGQREELMNCQLTINN
jgi:hypothetical protein